MRQNVKKAAQGTAPGHYGLSIISLNKAEIETRVTALRKDGAFAFRDPTEVRISCILLDYVPANWCYQRKGQYGNAIFPAVIVGDNAGMLIIVCGGNAAKYC